MRVLAFFAVFGLIGTGVFAEDADQCALTETWFNSAVQARLDGDGKGKVRRTLRKEMGKTAAEQLAEFVFALPVEQLTPEVGKAARAQCDAL